MYVEWGIRVGRWFGEPHGQVVIHCGLPRTVVVIITAAGYQVSIPYLVAAGYPNVVSAALNWCVPLVLDGVADLSELLAEMRLLSYNPSTALIMAEEIFAPQQPSVTGGCAGGGLEIGKSGDAVSSGGGGGGGGPSGGGGSLPEGETVSAESGDRGDLPLEHGSNTALAFKHLVNALRAAVEPYPQPPNGQPPPLNGQGQLPLPELIPWSKLCTTQREQFVDELLTLADLLMIAHAVLLTLRTALSYAVDRGGVALAAAAGALRREVAEVQTMRVAASRMLVERMEMQERSAEPLYPNYLYNCRNRHHNHQHNRQSLNKQQHPDTQVSTAATAAAAAPAIANGQGAAAAAANGNTENSYGNGSGGGDGSGGGGASSECEELDEQMEEVVSWRHVNGLYEHSKTVLQCAADAAAAMLDPQARAEDAARCDALVTALFNDLQMLDGLVALAAMPPYHRLPLAQWDPIAAAAASFIRGLAEECLQYLNRIAPPLPQPLPLSPVTSSPWFCHGAGAVEAVEAMVVGPSSAAATSVAGLAGSAARVVGGWSGTAGSGREGMNVEVYKEEEEEGEEAGGLDDPS
ncbi:hypothetical protein VOLCADRAFT_91924 [Volvox carteri f. nagariensis]|uniref:Uncharacterized protein n=1 Tax=Volvox carteri f. nagariensis TaxID=3068 RepID=D8TYB3_VOLCA|nr:uncharacterized protein VOLCADRAFT_91924 [Volvox carteri f. nagariensis]EFJ47523.1 hypothetical protein VOLCADRAFT_91924 [Volvox carteri f. nagariensis]|eukprot:XP_002951347.1 hypothetical protein VOLCADRAFT_91924 [Volvox carteri f. nagariensis]